MRYILILYDGYGGCILNFRIGKIADLLGMSTEGLRLYERSGIVKPKRGENNTAYRTYGHLENLRELRKNQQMQRKTFGK